MLFSFHCPACKGRLEADASLSGSQAECPQCGKPVAIPAPRVAAGTTLAGFRLERRLGKGGMGEVYLAQQLSVERQVAVKILPPGFAENPQAVKRFLHEGRVAAKLDHAHIVTVFDAGEDSGIYYLAMAYVEGESLDQRLKRDGALPEAEALGIIRAIADALAYAWERFQLLHRDLKPANIMVDQHGRVFLMDLGLAKSLGEEGSMTLSGSILGSPQYMSPEQAQGRADLGVPTDVYALGATLYHLVAGAPPFAGETTLAVLHKHMYEPLPPPRARNPKVTDVCSHLIEAMMAKEPAGRYSDWRALIADIDRVLQGRAPSAHRPGPGAPVVSPVPRKPTGVLPSDRRPRAPSDVSLEPAVRPGTAGASAASPAVSRADLARQAKQALARQQQASTRPPAAPSERRVSPLAACIAAAAVLVAVLAMVLALRGRSGASAAGAAGSVGPAPQSAAAGGSANRGGRGADTPLAAAPVAATLPPPPTAPEHAAPAAPEPARTAVPAPVAPLPSGAVTSARPKQRYEGIFLVGIFTAIFGPPGEKDLDSPAAQAWQRDFLATVKGLGFNAVVGCKTVRSNLPSGMMRQAAEMGLYAVTGDPMLQELGRPQLTEEEARKALAERARLCREHRNLIAGFMNTDPVQPVWLEPWRVLGRVWNETCPDVPLLATYSDAAQWRQFDQAAPVGAAQGWVYPFKDGVSAAQALNSPLVTRVDCADARRAMPGLAVWPWIQGMAGLGGLRWPSLAEHQAVFGMMLAEGARGGIMFLFIEPGEGVPVSLADKDHTPCQRLLDLGPTIQAFARMGTELLDYDVVEGACKDVPSRAVASLFVHRADRTRQYIMVASRELTSPLTFQLAWDAGTETSIAGLRDFLDGAEIPVRQLRAQGASVACDVTLPPATGRLLAVIRK